MSGDLTVVAQNIYDFYADLYAQGIGIFLLAILCSWCCLAHGVLQPLCTCRKRRNKLDRSCFYTKEQSPWPLIGAHKGGYHERAESTLPAFLWAAECGVNLMELDCSMTKDNVIVISHDDKVDRITDGKGLISSFNYADLPPYSKYIPYGQSKGGYTLTEKDDGKWCKLDTLFANMPNTVLYSVDLKHGSETCARLVYEIIKKYGIQNRIIWRAYDAPVASLLTELDPDISIFYLGKPRDRLLKLHILGLLWLFPLTGDDYSQKLMDSEQVEKERFMHPKVDRDWHEYWKRILIVKLNNFFGIWMYPQLSRRGNIVVLWMPNEFQEFDKIKDFYRVSFVDGVMTDCPSKLKEWIDVNYLGKRDGLKSTLLSSNEKDGQELTVFEI